MNNLFPYSVSSPISKLNEGRIGFLLQEEFIFMHSALSVIPVLRKEPDMVYTNDKKFDVKYNKQSTRQRIIPSNLNIRNIKIIVSIILREGKSIAILCLLFSLQIHRSLSLRF